MSTAPTRSLAFVGRSLAGEPRLARLHTLPARTGRDAAYRQLAATIVGLDVATLASELRSQRLARQAQTVRAA